jgi:L-ribulose-5-phosphate 3-epimerase
MNQLFPIAAITDEFSPDMETAARSMAEIGMTGAELRVVSGKNIIDLSDAELSQALDILAAQRLQVVSIASPLLKCVLPDSPEVDARFQQDIFASRHTFADQPRLAARAFEIAERTGARIIRVFSYWRSVQPEACFERIARALGELAAAGAQHGRIIGLENEHACNIATGAETARLLEAVTHPNLKVVWDPANAYVSGETPFPDGYRRLPPGRIVHVHAKDCFVRDHRPAWGPLGECGIDWKGQIAALSADGYQGYISLETHWGGPGGDKHQASMICGRNLKALVDVPLASRL